MGLILQSISLLLASVFGWIFYEYVVKATCSPLRQLPGPVSRGLFPKHLKFVMECVHQTTVKVLHELTYTSHPRTVLNGLRSRTTNGLSDLGLTCASKDSTGYATRLP